MQRTNNPTLVNIPVNYLSIYLNVFNKLTNHSQLKYEKCKKNTFIASRLNWFFELSKIEMSIHFLVKFIWIDICYSLFHMTSISNLKSNALHTYHQVVCYRYSI